MALDGVAAIRARIQAIEQQVTGLGPSSPATTAGTGAPSGVDFASLLNGAMNTDTAASALGGSTTAGTPDISTLLSKLTSASTATAAAGATANITTSRFLDAALAQAGKPYVWGASTSPTDPNPTAFDCSELTKWAAARAGTTIPDGAAHQYVWLKEHGATMTVQQALQTPGALLFSFTNEPQPGLTSEPAHAHVAISLGNGKTIEAKGHAYGVGVFDATNRFQYAGMIPGMT